MPRSPRILAACAVVTFAVASLPLAFSSAGASDDDQLYRALSDFRVSGAQVRVDPESYTAVRVDVAELRAELADDSTVLEVPTPDGGTERFAVEQTQVMAPGLAAAHPEIRTFSGRSLDNPGSTIALDLTPMGFHASVRDAGAGTAWYVDPAYDVRGTSVHLSYAGSSLPRPEEELAERELPAAMKAASARTAPRARAAAGESVEQRVYRLALLSDPQYAEYFGTSNVTAEKVTLINRVNQIYNDDLAINLQLIEGTDLLNLDTDAKATGKNGPCGAHACFDLATKRFPGDLDVCWPGTLVRAGTVLGQLVGASAYDVGHVVLGDNGGGIAGLGVVGGRSKAMGCTGLPEPQGDFFAVDYVAHELGHQFGGNHTFDGNQGSCFGGNRNRSSSVEPGSGSSVMAYAGICAHDDLQPHTDPYFSGHTIAEVSAYASGVPVAQVEVQTVSLSGFDADGESVLIGYDGAEPVTVTRGVDYDAAGLEAAVEQVTGQDVRIRGWGFDPKDTFPQPAMTPDNTGFSVVFAGDKIDVAPLVVTSSSPGVSAAVGEASQGGPAGNGGSLVNPTDNHAPVVTAPPARTLPMRTPFTLTGSATDEDGDAVSYLWEQTDTGDRNGTTLVTNKRFSGPLFRVFGRYADVSDEAAGQIPSPGQNHAGPNGSRTFPDMFQILAGTTNAATGRCPEVPPASPNPNKYKPVKLRVLNCYSEFLPIPGYVGTAGSKRPAMHFRLTARDGAPLGGGVGHDDVTLRLDRRAGPFLVSSLAGDRPRVDAGSARIIRWQVNGTRKLARQVQITLSTDNGRTWEHVLVDHTANDGEAKVTFPDVRSRKAWLRISAVDNYFFDVNDSRFRIG
ncbi:M12 family metallo-peptidase [Nocardioides sp. SR21]|uniref:M12 family metallo-peptidase n=1 Tax=Nocardioides sp. SR21 TaxID=2919501 RepID=UPI001FA96E34|nr:M12 family metallo-peptidase [Nocardioides sp. SR21]